MVLFVVFYLVYQKAVERVFIPVLTLAHVEVQDGIRRPFRLELFYGETLEQIFSSFEVRVESACEEGLAEPARATEKHILRIALRHPVDQLRLVHIDVSLLPQLLEGLYPRRVSPLPLRLHSLFRSSIAKLSKIFSPPNNGALFSSSPPHLTPSPKYARLYRPSRLSLCIPRALHYHWLAPKVGFG